MRAAVSAEVGAEVAAVVTNGVSDTSTSMTADAGTPYRKAIVETNEGFASSNAARSKPRSETLVTTTYPASVGVGAGVGAAQRWSWLQLPLAQSVLASQNLPIAHV